MNIWILFDNMCSAALSHMLIIKILMHMHTGMLLMGKVFHKLKDRSVTTVNTNTVTFCICGFPWDATMDAWKLNHFSWFPDSALFTCLCFPLAFYRPGSNKGIETDASHRVFLAPTTTTTTKQLLTVFRKVCENRHSLQWTQSTASLTTQLLPSVVFEPSCTGMKR